jgi:hypothetical protein
MSYAIPKDFGTDFAFLFKVLENTKYDKSLLTFPVNVFRTVSVLRVVKTSK